jgi:hypothetical protein
MSIKGGDAVGKISLDEGRTPDVTSIVESTRSPAKNAFGT